MRVHAGQQRGAGATPFIEHPLEVARLLRDAGCAEPVIAAGLLHDVLENTDVSSDELHRRFGADVAGLVGAVTDDASHDDYVQRKAQLREKVRQTGGSAALIFAADKISGARWLQRQDNGGPGEGTRVEHYRDSLRMLEDVAGDHPLVQRLARELGDGE